MHPDTSRQLAAERLADFRRQAEAGALAAHTVRLRRHRLRAGLRWPLSSAYARRDAAAASAGAARRSGT
jgi:hypothetical protein